jgi:hypothetical protein
MKKCNIRGLTEQEALIAEAIRPSIYQYRAAAKQLAATNYYVRTHTDYTASIYHWDGTELNHVATTTRHRVGIIRDRHSDYLAGRIHPDVWDSYCIRGATTRIGIDRAQALKIKSMAR